MKLKDAVIFFQLNIWQTVFWQQCYSTYFQKLFTKKFSYCCQAYVLGTISLTRITVLCCWLWLIFCGTFHKNTKFPRFPPAFCLYNCTLKSTKTIVTILGFKPISQFFKAMNLQNLIKMQNLIKIFWLAK